MSAYSHKQTLGIGCRDPSEQDGIGHRVGCLYRNRYRSHLADGPYITRQLSLVRGHLYVGAILFIDIIIDLLNDPIEWLTAFKGKVSKADPKAAVGG